MSQESFPRSFTKSSIVSESFSANNMSRPIQESHDDRCEPIPVPRERVRYGGESEQVSLRPHPHTKNPDMKKEFAEYAQSTYAPVKLIQQMQHVEHAAYGGNMVLATETMRSLFAEWKSYDAAFTRDLEYFASKCRGNPVKCALLHGLAALDRGKTRAARQKDAYHATQRIYKICLLIMKLTKNDNRSGILNEQFLRKGATPMDIAELLAKLLIQVYDELSSKLESYLENNSFAVNWIALACFSAKDINNAEIFCNIGIKMLEGKGTSLETLVRLCQTKGNLHRRRNELDMAKSFLKRAMELVLNLPKSTECRESLLGHIENDLEKVYRATEGAEDRY